MSLPKLSNTAKERHVEKKSRYILQQRSPSWGNYNFTFLQQNKQSGSFRGLEWVPAMWRCLVPDERRDGAQSHPLVATRSQNEIGFMLHLR